MKFFAVIICLIGHQRAAAYSSDSISCDGDIDTPYDCYQCFDVVAGKYFWGSSCKAKKLASADMVNGKCGLDYTCVTKDIGTCPYNDYCPDNAKRSGQHLNNGYSWSPNVESVFKYTSADLGNALRKTGMPYSTILSHPLKLEGEVKVQAFNDQTLRVKLDHIHFYSNGTEISLTNAHQILDTERSNGGLLGHTAQIFENSLIAPFMVLTKGGVLKKMIVSKNEPAEVTEIKKMLASDLEMKTNQAQLRLVRKKAINTPLATPRFPTNIDLGSPSDYLSTTITAQKGTERRFSINVPSGKSYLTVAISGGTGDADLYVKYGKAPSLASWDCRPYEYGNSESCTIYHQYAGTWYIMVYAYSNYSGVKLTAGDRNGAVQLNQIQTEMVAPDNKKGEELDRLFDKATRYIRNLPPNHLGLSLETQLFFYSRYKQVKVGPCNIPKPYFRDTMATQKWKAWKNLGNMSKEQAKSEYIQKLDTVAPRWRNKDR